MMTNRRSTDFDPMDERYWRFARRSPHYERNIPFVEDTPAPQPGAERWRHALAAVAWTLAAVAVVVATAGDARAEAIAVASDNEDRRIILTDEECTMGEYKKSSVLRAIAVIRGQLFTGCWGKFKYDDSQIILLFPNNVSAVMGTSQFRPANNND